MKRTRRVHRESGVSLMLFCAVLLAVPGVSAGQSSASGSKKAADAVSELKERKRVLDTINMRFLSMEPEEARAVWQAKQALVAIGAPAVPLIDKELQQKMDADWIDVLEGIGEPAVPVLAKHVRDGKKTVIWALFRLGPKSRAAIPMLVAVMDDEAMAEEAAYVIEHLGTPEPGAVSALLDFAKDEKHAFRQGWAVMLLGGMGRDAQGAVGDLAELLRTTDDPARRRGVIFAMGKIGGKNAVAVLTKCLSSEEEGDGTLLAAVVEALGATGDGSALPLLVDQLLRQDRSVHTAMPAFMNFGEEALPHLLPHLGSNDPETRERTVRAICELRKADSAMPELRRALGDSRRQVRVMAAYGIGKIGPDARSCVPDLLKMMGSEECPAVPLAQISVGNPADAELAVEALVAVLRNERRAWQERENAAKGLAILGRSAASALGPLRSTVEEIPASNSCVRVAAEEAIRKITTP